MYMKRVLAFILILLMLVTSVSCSLGPGSQVSGEKKDALNSGGSKELTMYVLDYDTAAQNAVEKFNQTHKNVQIKSKQLTVNELGGKLMYELNSGDGADIIIGTQDTLPNLSVFFNKGSFYDLNTFMDNDKAFKKSDYFEKVFDYGVFKGKRCVLPLSFEIDSLYTTKDMFDKSGQGITDRGAGIDKFVEASKNHVSAGNNNNCFVSYIDIGSLLQTAAKPFFSLEEKTAGFESKEFGDLLDKYKALSDKMAAKALSTSPTEKNSLLSNNKVILQNVMSMNPRYTAEPYSSFKSEVEPVLMPSVYSDTARHIIAKPEKYIGINSKCGNVGAAYEFIKLLLSKEYQDVDTIGGIPVNREAYKQAKENCIKGLKGYDLWKTGGIKKTSTVKKLFSQIDELIEGIDRCWTTDDYVLTIVRNEVDNYLKSNSTRDNTLKTIQQKVDGYLKSGFMAEDASKEVEEPSDPLKTLAIYYWNCTESNVFNAMYYYNEKYPDIKLDLKTFSSYEEFYKTTGVELMAGGGPDIVLFQPRYFNSVNKVLESGALCPMDEYIEKYDVLNFSDYNRGLLDSGIYNGKRYYIPLLYYYSPMLSRKSWLDENNIVIKDGEWSWQKFIDYSKEFMKKNKGKDKYFVTNGFGIYKMLENCDIELIDYKNKKSNFDSSEFRNLLILCKELLPATNPKEYKYDETVKNGRSLFFGALMMGNPASARVNYLEVADYDKEEMVAVPTPSYSGKFGNYTLGTDCIGVNTKCRNKEAAFNFVKIIASVDLQKQFDSRGKVNIYIEAPVNAKAYSEDIKALQSAGSIPGLLADSLIRQHSLLKGDMIKDYNIFDMAANISSEYIDGKKSVDQVIKEIDDKVNLFLNE